MLRHQPNPLTPFPGARAEGAQAQENPFVDAEHNPGAYLPVGLFNRFDLAAEDGSDCGEYRLAFARRSGVAPLYLDKDSERGALTPAAR